MLMGATGLAAASQDDEVTSYLDGLVAQVAQARSAVETDPSNGEAWQALVFAESTRAATEVGMRGEGQAAAQLAGRRASEAVISEWESRRPRDGGPHLARIYLEADSAERGDRILDLADRFPDDLRILQQAAQVHQSRGEHDAALRMLDGYRERHPDDPAAYRLLHGSLKASGDTGGARAVVRSWLDRRPGDAEALTAWLRLSPEPQFHDETRERIAAMLDELARASAAGDAELQLCDELLRVARGSFRAEGDRCVTRVTQLVKDPRLIERLELVRLREAARAGDLSAFERALEGADAARAGRVVQHYLMGLGYDACQERVRVARRVWEQFGAAEDYPAQVASHLEGCHEFLEAQRLFLEFAARVPADRLRDLLMRWNPNYPNRRRTHLPFEQLGPVLEARWQREGYGAEIADALDLLYEAAELPERRLDLFRRRARTPHPMTDTWRMTGLADALLATGDVGGAADLLEGVLASQPGETKALERLIELRLLLGEPEKARATAERALAQDLGAGPATAARRGLARIALAEGDADEAVRQYRRALEGTADGHWSEPVAKELLNVLALLERTDDAVRFAAELCSDTDLRRGEGRDLCAARRLEEIGLDEQAAPYFDAAMRTSPDTVELLQAAARNAERRGDLVRAERLLRQVVAFDPEDEGPWASLGLLWMNAGDVDRQAAVLAEAERALGIPSILLRTQHAKVLLAAGRGREAALVIEELKRLRPDLTYLDGLLRDAYRAAAAE